jgi:hypothetical protein
VLCCCGENVIKDRNTLVGMQMVLETVSCLFTHVTEAERKNEVLVLYTACTYRGVTLQPICYLGRIHRVELRVV